jgi:mRNA interferase MazF
LGALVKGDVVVIPFPFSDLSATKRRPALVLAALPGEDVILCQITSRARTNESAIGITSNAFTEGSLHQDSNVRPERLFTADSRITRRIGRLSTAKVQAVVSKVILLLTA